MTCSACSALSASVPSAASCSLSAEPKTGCSVGTRRPRRRPVCLPTAGTDGAAGFITIGCCSSRIWPDSTNASYYD